jgi:hypothetical protein
MLGENTGKKLNEGDAGGKNKVFEVREESKQLAESVKMDCSRAGKIPSSKITFRDMYTYMEDGSKHRKPL